MDFDPTRPNGATADFASHYPSGTGSAGSVPAHPALHALPPEPPAAPTVNHPADRPGSGVAGSARRPSRAEIAERRRKEREGVPFRLDQDEATVTVRLLNLYEQATIAGLPLELQELVLRSARDGERGAPKTTAELIATIGENERMLSQVCVLGFVSPRLVMTEAELDGSDDCWLVTDVHLADRQKYFGLITGGQKEELARIRAFLRGGSALADAGAAGGVPAAQAAV